MHLTEMVARFTAKRPQPDVETSHTRTHRAAPAPAHRRSRVTTNNIALRCLTPTDAHHMTDLVQRLSPQSRYMRYFRLVRSFAAADIARFVAVSPSHLAVGAFDGGSLVGAAQYFRSAQCPDRAEVALEVADSHHRRGVGARLVHELARLAAREGITHFTATVLAENRAVLGLIRHSGWDMSTTIDGSYTDVVVTLPPHTAEADLRRRSPQAFGAPNESRHETRKVWRSRHAADESPRVNCVARG